tara:strand:- start:3781 stop:4074 length:294 start_codon:yes stop_codon:yes gene_type:complete
MDRIFTYVEQNKEYMRDQDYKTILDIIMEEKNREKHTFNIHQIVKEKLHHLTNDYVRLSKAFLSMVLERDGCIIGNALPSNSLDMEYEIFSLTPLPT